MSLQFTYQAKKKTMLTYNDLNGFTGSEQFYRHSMVKNFTYTEGVKYLAEEAEAYWLIDAIASYQPKLQKIEMARYFQLWYLTNRCDDEDADVNAARILAARAQNKLGIATLRVVSPKVTPKSELTDCKEISLALAGEPGNLKSVRYMQLTLFDLIQEWETG
jgi:hypothetical protein